MVFPASAPLLEALNSAHDMTTTVFVMRGDTVTQIEVVDVTCQATFGTQGGRSATLTVDRGILDDGWLDPLQDEVVIRTGVEGVGEIPLFVGRVVSPVDDEAGQVEVALWSRADELVRAGFEVPYPSTRGLPTTEQMRRIVQSVNPAWTVQADVAFDPLVLTDVWEEDPGEALDALAKSANAIWLPNRVGGFDVSTNPYTLTEEPPSVLTVRDGVDGVLVQVRHVKSRESIFNSVTVIVERTDGLAPIRVTVRDDDPTSPTYWGGPFGKQNLKVKTQTVSTRAAATLIAHRILTQSLAIARSWSITMPPGVGQVLDPGDVIGVWYRDEVTAQVVESIRYAGHSRSTVVTETRQFRTMTPVPED